LGALSGGNITKDAENHFPFRRKNYDIVFPEEWKVFSIREIGLAPYAGQFMANMPGLSGSPFGIPIAKVGICDRNAHTPLR
jgi:hypothetical protein